MQIVGRPFDDATVLRVAHAYESATPWRARRPVLEPNAAVSSMLPPIPDPAKPEIGATRRDEIAAACRQAGLGTQQAALSAAHCAATPYVEAMVGRLRRDPEFHEEPASMSTPADHANWRIAGAAENRRRPGGVHVLVLESCRRWTGNMSRRLRCHRHHRHRHDHGRARPAVSCAQAEPSPVLREIAVLPILTADLRDVVNRLTIRRNSGAAGARRCGLGLAAWCSGDCRLALFDGERRIDIVRTAPTMVYEDLAAPAA